MKALSHSSISTYNECPKKWELKYVVGLKEKPKHYFSFGKAIHSALETMYGMNECPSLNRVLRAYEEAWSSAGYKSLKDEIKAKAEGRAMLEAYYTKYAPTWEKPLAVEMKFNIWVDHVKVTGFVDRVDALPGGTLRVIDYKTGKEFEPGRIDTDEQMTMYQIAMEEMFPGMEVGELRLDHVPTLAPQTAARRGAEQVAAMRQKVLDTASEIADQQFEAKPSEAACKWCDFKANCPVWATSPE